MKKNMQKEGPETRRRRPQVQGGTDTKKKASSPRLGNKKKQEAKKKGVCELRWGVGAGRRSGSIRWHPSSGVAVHVPRGGAGNAAPSAGLARSPETPSPRKGAFQKKDASPPAAPPGRGERGPRAYNGRARRRRTAGPRAQPTPPDSQHRPAGCGPEGPGRGNRALEAPATGGERPLLGAPRA